MKLTNVTITNPETGEQGQIERKDYAKHVVKEMDVKPFESEASGTNAPDKVVNHILRSFEDDKQPDEAIANAYPQLVTRVEEDYKATVAAKEQAKAEAASAAEKKKAEAEAAKKEKEEKAAQLVATQGAFVTSVNQGAEVAQSEFAEELKALASSLPEGATFVEKNGHYGLVFDKKADKSVIGQTLGYLVQKQANSGFIANQLQFWIGDAIIAATAAGVYATAGEAQKHIASELEKASGKKYEHLSLAQYKRMAERTPVELRNPKVDPTAYLAISSAARPKKGEKETDDQFKARAEAFDADILDIQSKLAGGELTKRKDVLPLVEAALVKHGMKEKADDTPKPSASQQAIILFHANFALENLAHVHEDGFIVYRHESHLVKIPVASMEEIRDAALANLTNMFYASDKLNIKAADFIRGFVTSTKKVEVGKGADGKPVMDDQTTETPVYPAPFFDPAPYLPKEEAAK